MNLGLSAGGPGGWRPCSLRGGRRQQQQRLRRSNAAAGDGAATQQRGSYMDKIRAQGLLRGPLKAALTSGSMSALGDLLAQFLMAQTAKSSGKPAPAYEFGRTARMFGFGLAFYGPYQFYWYSLLDWLMPARTTANFLTKVTANQLALAPIVLAAVFAWNLTLTGQGHQLKSKLERDLVPSMLNGWKFWVPAASINFCLVPLQQQVLYMSCCGVLWTAYLSYASSTPVAAR